jgi:cytochrome c553
MFCKNIKAIIAMAFIYICAFFPIQALAAPDALVGKAKSQTCFACHGADGMGISANIPHIAAQPPLSLFYQLVQYREGMRKGGGMEVFAKSLSDGDIRDIAAYFSALPPPPAKAGDAVKIALGQKLSQQNYCNSCHAPQLQGQKQVPRLAGQSIEYAVTQLRNIRSGSRVDMDGTMGSAARGLSDEDIEVLAAYAASLN